MPILLQNINLPSDPTNVGDLRTSVARRVARRRNSREICVGVNEAMNCVAVVVAEISMASISKLKATSADELLK